MKTKYVLLLPVKWYQAVRTAEKAQSVRQSATVLRYTFISYLVCGTC